MNVTKDVDFMSVMSSDRGLAGNDENRAVPTFHISGSFQTTQ